MVQGHYPHPEGKHPLPYPLASTIPAGPPDQAEQPYRSRLGAVVKPGDIATKDPYAALKHFNTVFLIDDSASMEPYWGEVGALLSKIAPICTEYDPNGIDIEFLNHRARARSFWPTTWRGYRNIGIANGVPEMRDNVLGIYRGVKPKGKGWMDSCLGDILGNSFYNYVFIDYGKQNLPPLNLIVIAAGFSEDDPRKSLVETARRLDIHKAPLHQVGVQFFLVGNQSSIHKGVNRIPYIDDQLFLDEGVRDIADTVTWTGKKPGELGTFGE
ncbi:Uu.00g131560.m01.CDS01 [Anthostomella pinea]|uniref:Uu.00g131560.m01.CDS01 n=1 Tax=Anthostomella pinea TaxID=933095 RepID=A0AAI8YIE6_9PEZI|nr:Uu.00g131560.m01.CDS01 [Anthostomella pinea]